MLQRLTKVCFDIDVNVDIVVNVVVNVVINVIVIVNAAASYSVFV